MWDFDVYDRETGSILLYGAGFKSSEAAAEQAIMEAEVQGVKNYFVRVSYVDDIYEECLSVDIPGGKMVAYKNCDPNAPGISVMLQPEGCDYEIDLAYLESVSDPDYGMSYTGLGDIGIYVFGNPFDEDCTNRVVIKSEEIKESIGITG